MAHTKTNKKFEVLLFFFSSCHFCFVSIHRFFATFVLQLVHEVVESRDLGLETLALADGFNGNLSLGAEGEGIGGELLPVVEDALREGLATSAGAEISGEAEGLGDGEVGTDVVDGGAGAVFFTDDDTTAASEDTVDATHGVLDGLDVDLEDGLDEAGSGGELARVEDTAGGGDDLTTTTVNGISVHGDILDVDADTAHVFVGQATFLGGPLPGGGEGVLHFVHVLDTLGDVDDDVGAAAIGTVAPDLAGIGGIPLELFLEDLGADLGFDTMIAGTTVFHLDGELVLEGSTGAEETVVLVGGLGQALHGGLLGDGFTEGHDGLGDLEGSAVHEVILEILEANFKVELTGTSDDVLAGLLDGADDEGIGLGEALEAFNELGEIGGVLDFDGDTDDGGDGVLHVTEGVSLLAILGGDGGSLDDVLVDTDETDDVTAGHVVDGFLVTTHHEDGTLDGLVFVQVVLLAVCVVVAHDADLATGGDLAGEDAAEGEEAALVGGGDHLGDVEHEGSVGVALLDALEEGVFDGGLAGVEHFSAVGLGGSGGGEVHDDHLEESVGGGEELHHDGLDELLGRLLHFVEGHDDVEGLEHLVELVGLLGHDGVEELVDGVQAELAEGALDAFALTVDLGLDPLLVLGVEEGVTPEALAHLGLVNTELGGVHLGEAGDGECPGLEAGTDGDGTFIGGDLEVAHDGVVVGGDDDVDVLEGLDETLVGLFGVELELEDGAVDLVDENDGADTLGEGLTEDGLGLDADTFDAIDDDEGTISDAEGGSDFRGEVDVSGGVDEVDQEVAFFGLESLNEVVADVVVEGDGGGLDGDTTSDFIRTGVEKTSITGGFLLDDTGGGDEGVGEGGLAVIDVGNDGHVADLFRSRHQVLNLFNGELDHFLTKIYFLILFFFRFFKETKVFFFLCGGNTTTTERRENFFGGQLESFCSSKYFVRCDQVFHKSNTKLETF